MQRRKLIDCLPISVDLRNRRCVVVGGRANAATKVEWLLRAQADVTVVSASLCNDLEQRRFAGEISHEAAFSEHTLEATMLVVMVDDDEDLKARIWRDARVRNVLVNAVDDPARCTFRFPAIVDRSPITIAISSDGRSPTLSKLVREQLEVSLPPSLGTLARFAGRLRSTIQRLIPNTNDRRRFWASTLRGPIATSIYRGDEKIALRLFNRSIEKFNDQAPRGEVSWVLIGSPDPDDITMKGLRTLQQADIVLFDDDLDPMLLEYARRDAQHVTHCAGDLIAKDWLEQAAKGESVCRVTRTHPRATDDLRRACLEGVATSVVEPAPPVPARHQLHPPTLLTGT